MRVVRKSFDSVRFASLIAVICSLAGSVLMFFIGAVKTVKAFVVIVTDPYQAGVENRLATADLATKFLIKSIDAFLIGMVLLIFGFGVYNLFIKKLNTEVPEVMDWVSIPSIGHLKNKLAEIIVVILFVKFLEVVLLSLNKLEWELLVLPASILLLAVSLKFLKLER